MQKLLDKYDSFVNALERLKEAIDLYEQKENTVLLDGTIQRFEFTVELAWKTIKAYFEYEKLGEFNSPRSIIKEAFKMGLISDGEEWLDMLDDRNLTSHTYDETVAKEIYNNIITKYYKLFEKLKNNLECEINNNE